MQRYPGAAGGGGAGGAGRAGAHSIRGARHIVLIHRCTAVACKPELYRAAGLVVAAHIHYGTCVVREMCDHLHIRPFHIRQGGEREEEGRERLLGQEELSSPV